MMNEQDPIITSSSLTSQQQLRVFKKSSSAPVGGADDDDDEDLSAKTATVGGVPLFGEEPTTVTTGDTAIDGRSGATNNTLDRRRNDPGGGSGGTINKTDEKNDNDDYYDDEEEEEGGEGSPAMIATATTSRFFQKRSKRDMRKKRTASRCLELLSMFVHQIEKIRIPRRWCWCILGKKKKQLNQQQPLNRLRASSVHSDVADDEEKNYRAVNEDTTRLTSDIRDTDGEEQQQQHKYKHDGNIDDEEEEGIPLITGLDRVILGTVPASDAVLICTVRPPQYFWYMVSGTLCDVVQFFIDYFVHRALHVQDPSVCWVISFTLSIVARHSSHRYLVFGAYVGGYWNSLLRMYGGYSIIIVLSTVFNIIMTKGVKISHYVAWIITLLWTGIVNYFILKKLWTFGGINKKDAVGEGEERSR